MLATEATALVHGRAAAEEAAETARRTFEEGALAETLPTVEIPRGELDTGLGVLAAFVRPASSPATARRGVRSRAAASRSTTPPVTDEKMLLTRAQLTPKA